MKSLSLICIMAALLSIAGGNSIYAAQQNKKATVEKAPKNPQNNANRVDPESRLKKLTEALSLTEDQQAKLKAAYKEEQKAMQELRKDSQFAALPGPEKREKVTALRQKTNEKIASFLDTEQKAKFKEFNAQQSANRGQGQKQTQGPKKERKQQ